jgi:Protein of unknown function (DUF2695)
MTVPASSQPPDRIDLMEHELQLLSQQLTAPLPNECLYCYLCRMIDEFWCCGDHRFTKTWADGRRVRGRPIVDWARATHGYCDCEVLLNSLGRRSTRRVGLVCAGVRRRLEARDAAW